MNKKEKINPNFDINAKYEDMINTAIQIIEHHEFVSNGSCEPPNYICLAYDVKNYLPKLQQENKLLRDRIRQGSSIYVIHNFEPDTNIVDLIDLLKDYEKDKQLERIKGESNE